MVTRPRQFDVCINRGANCDRVPLLLALQHAVANELETRLAVPLIPAERRKRLMAKIEPVIRVEGAPYVAVVSQVRAVPLADFGDVLTNAQSDDRAFIDALDFLVTGY